MAMSPRLLVWREDNIWSAEPDWRFGHPIMRVIAEAFYGHDGRPGGGPKLLRNVDMMTLLAGLPKDSIPYHDRASIKEVLGYLASGGDLHAEWEL